LNRQMGGLRRVRGCWFMKTNKPRFRSQGPEGD
jgi:hypothetical protein